MAPAVHTHLLTWATLEQPRLSMAEHPEITATRSPDVYPWLPETGAEWRVGGQEWHLGWDPAQLGAVYRDLIAESTDGSRIHLESGTAVAVTPGFDRLWLTLSHRWALYVDRDIPHQVRVFDTLTDQVHTILGGTGGPDGAVGLEGAPPTPDISGHCWKLPDSPPPGALEHEERWRLRFSDLEHFWHSNETGAITPLATGMHDAHATLHGSWPDRTLRVIFRHPLYDELGRPAGLEYDDVLLMEDLGTNHIPPLDEAQNGILDM